jgi:hypothetical protein
MAKKFYVEFYPNFFYVIYDHHITVEQMVPVILEFITLNNQRFNFFFDTELDPLLKPFSLI